MFTFVYTDTIFRSSDLHTSLNPLILFQQFLQHLTIFPANMFSYCIELVRSTKSSYRHHSKLFSYRACSEYSQNLLWTKMSLFYVNMFWSFLDKPCKKNNNNNLTLTVLLCLTRILFRFKARFTNSLCQHKQIFWKNYFFEQLMLKRHGHNFCAWPYICICRSCLRNLRAHWYSIGKSRKLPKTFPKVLSTFWFNAADISVGGSFEEQQCIYFNTDCPKLLR